MSAVSSAWHGYPVTGLLYILSFSSVEYFFLVGHASWLVSFYLILLGIYMRAQASVEQAGGWEGFVAEC